MKLPTLSALLILCLTANPLCSTANPPPNEDHCRRAIAAGLEQLRLIPPNLSRRDDADRRKLLEEMERLVEANRRKGVSECRTWTEMMGKAFNQ